MTGDLIFILLALLTLVPAVWVVLSRNLVHAGFGLLFTLFGAAGLYAYMGADFIAVTQLMVYIGGVLVLVLFTVMMTHVPRSRQNHGLDRYVPAAVFALLVFGVLYKTITAVPWHGAAGPAEPTVAKIGVGIMTDYIFPFEYVSLVLLAAMIGAALLTRESRPTGGEEDAPAEETSSDQEVTS